MNNLARIILATILLFASGCGEQPQNKFRVALLTWVGYGPIHLAQNKGFFEGIEVELSVIEDTSARRAAFSTGKVDASTDIVDSFTNLLAAGAQGSAVLQLDKSMGGDGIVATNNINSISDLKGLSIAYPPGQPSHFFLLALLEEANMTIDDVKSLHMEADQAGSAFISGNVDAAVTWEPWLSKAAQMENGKILTTSRETPGLIADIFTVRNEYLAKNPEVVKAFIRGWFKAVAYWKENPGESNLIMANAMKIDVEEFKTMLAGVAYSDEAANREFFTRSDGQNSPYTDLVGKANRIWKKEGLVKKDVDPHAADGSAILFEILK